MYYFGVGLCRNSHKILGASLLGLPVVCGQRDDSIGRGIGDGSIIYFLGSWMSLVKLDELL